MMDLPSPGQGRGDSFLEPEAYASEAASARALDAVFARSWQLVLAAAPDQEGAVPFTLLPGSLDEPLLLARDAAGTLRCLSNVCTHRGNLLTDAPVPSRTLRCRYHGRCFDLQGRVLGAPGFEDVGGFPAARDRLPELPLRALGPLAFTALADPPPFEAWSGPVRERLAHLPLERLVRDGEGRRVYELDAHWALYVDNYLEGFHIPFVHHALARALDLAAYRTEVFPFGTVQVATARPGDAAFAPPPGHPDAGARIAAWYFWLFPNLMLNVYPWGLSLNLVRPRGPRATTIVFERWRWPDAGPPSGASADLHQVEMEDEAVVLAVQRGIRSRLYRPGTASPHHEAGVLRFHALLRASLGDSRRDAR